MTEEAQSIPTCGVCSYLSLGGRCQCALSKFYVYRRSEDAPACVQFRPVAKGALR